VSICACFFTKKIKVINQVVNDVQLSVIKPGETLSGKLYTNVPLDLLPGDYTFCFTTNSIFGPALENEMVKVTVEQ